MTIYKFSTFNTGTFYRKLSKREKINYHCENDWNAERYENDCNKISCCREHINYFNTCSNEDIEGGSRAEEYIDEEPVIFPYVGNG